VHDAPVHEPSGEIVNVVPAVTSPIPCAKTSSACVAYVRLLPAVMWDARRRQRRYKRLIQSGRWPKNS